MALAVASTSTAVANNAESLVITAPTGIDTGDLLILVLVQSQGGDVGIPSGFTEMLTADDPNDYLAMYYKVAVLADESAVNYTVTGGTDTLGGAVMLRVTGWSSGNPLYDSSTIEQSAVDLPSSVGRNGITVDRPSQQLLIMAYATADNDNDLPTGAGTYTVTSSDSNPTWTEVLDSVSDIRFAANNIDAAFAVAYAVSSDTSQITDYSIAIAGTPVIDTIFSMLAVIASPQDAPGNAVFATSTQTAFADPTGSAGGNGSPALKASTQTAFTPTGKGNAPTQWVNEAIENTDWTNEESL